MQLALEAVFFHLRRTANENLLYVRLRSASHAANGVSVDGRITPTDYGETLLADDALKHAFAVQTRMLFDRQECHADRILAGLGQSKPKRLALSREELVRDLNQHTGAVAGFGITTAGTAVGQVDEDLNSLLNDLMAFLSANTGDEPHTAGMLLIRRLVKTLRWRQAVHCLPVVQVTPEHRASY